MPDRTGPRRWLVWGLVLAAADAALILATFLSCYFDVRESVFNPLLLTAWSHPVPSLSVLGPLSFLNILLSYALASGTPWIDKHTGTGLATALVTLNCLAGWFTLGALAARFYNRKRSQP